METNYGKVHFDGRLWKLGNLKEWVRVTKIWKGSVSPKEQADRKSNQEIKENIKVINLLIYIVPNKILCKLDKYKNVNDCWMRPVNLHEDLSALGNKCKKDSKEEMEINELSNLQELRGRVLQRTP